MAKRHREPWIERTLKTWSDWVCTTARWQGWGSGVDRVGLISDAGWGRSRNPGTHSDPTLAEFMAAMAAGQSQCAGVHAEVMGLPKTERRVLVARYCGQPVIVQRVVDQDVMPSMRKVEKLIGARHLEMRWSGGPLPFAQVGALLGLAPSSCYEALDRAKLRLEFRLEVRRSIREGRFLPDSGTSREQCMAAHPEWYPQEVDDAA